MTQGLVCAGAGYLLGSIPFALLLPRWLAGVDVRTVASGNPGATNVMRTAGPLLGAVVMALDAAKGAAAVWLARRLGLSEPWVAAAGTAAILGHVYPVWLGGRGGKGVATSGGVFALLAPGPTGLAVLAFLLVVVLTRYVSVGSLVAAVVLPAAVAFSEAPRAALVSAMLAAAIVGIRHRANLQRLRAGTEPRLGARGSEKTLSARLRLRSR